MVFVLRDGGRIGIRIMDSTTQHTTVIGCIENLPCFSRLDYCQRNQLCTLSSRAVDPLNSPPPDSRIILQVTGNCFVQTYEMYIEKLGRPIVWGIHGPWDARVSLDSVQLADSAFRKATEFRRQDKRVNSSN
ncbi:hypothetical protein ACRALDRAFT_1065904 [Sodiomyces alcalophilus JCM 7366]|uniref:uncharacterized protein n=1 Tax=Sodiomyces alcalophilus JCM 7366 TaxID=591952 RepID=UPI0039B624AE